MLQHPLVGFVIGLLATLVLLSAAMASGAWLFYLSAGALAISTALMGRRAFGSSGP
ncbi:MAG: hypothetical protein R2737_03915 [Candidatus Nanopelagicales bacterium]